MFLARSAFWLTAAFIVMAPTAGVDMGQTARSTGEQLASRGAQAVADTLMPETCGTVECAVGRAVIGQTIANVGPATKAPTAAEPAPYEPASFPPPRPAWAY